MLIVSQFVYVGVIIVIVWNYHNAFFNILRLYSLYSALTCVRSIVNSKYELYISIAIVALAYWTSWTSSLFLSKWDTTLTL